NGDVHPLTSSRSVPPFFPFPLLGRYSPISPQKNRTINIAMSFEQRNRLRGSPLWNPGLAGLGAYLSRKVVSRFTRCGRGSLKYSSGVLSANENKMSDGGRERASFGVEVWKSSQK